jgi:hypothetical protein
MSFVVTLANFSPGIRLDGKPWTQAIIEEGALERGPFAAIDTQALSPLDTDPTKPQARSFTTTKATRESGWYRIKFQDGEGNSQVSGAVYSPVQGQLGPAGNATKLAARNGVRHQIRDGMPVGDVVPVPYNMVRLEPLTDQIPAEAATPTQTVFQVRYDLVPTQEHMTVQPVPGTLVAYVDGSWTPTAPSVDVDQNGNFTLPVPPLRSLQITYAWQYLSDGEIDNFVEESRRWLREFTEVSQVPDGLIGALTRYAAALALRALERSANIADQKAGDTEIKFSDLAKAYAKQSAELLKQAESEREVFYSRGPEPLEPFAEAESLQIDGYEPLR